MKKSNKDNNKKNDTDKNSVKSVPVTSVMKTVNKSKDDPKVVAGQGTNKKETPKETPKEKSKDAPKGTPNKNNKYSGAHSLRPRKATEDIPSLFDRFRHFLSKVGYFVKK